MPLYRFNYFDELDDFDNLDDLIESIGRFPGDFTRVSCNKFFQMIMILIFILMFLQISQEIYLLYDCYHNDDCFMKQKNNFL